MADRVLLIESDDKLREELSASLAKDGFAITAVPNYSDDWLSRKESNTDVVIMGTFLPGVDIMEACRQIGTILDIPVVLLDESPGDESWDNAVKANAVLYESKLFSHRMLAAKVRAILRRYKRRSAKDL